MTKIRPVGPQNDHSLQVDACKTASATVDLYLTDYEISCMLTPEQLDSIQTDIHFLNSRSKLQFHGKEMPCRASD